MYIVRVYTRMFYKIYMYLYNITFRFSQQRSVRPITQQVASLVDRVCGVGGRSATISTVDTQSGELQLLELKRRFYDARSPRGSGALSILLSGWF